MIFYLLPKELVTIFLSFNLLTTLTFEDDIEHVLYGGSKEEVFWEITNQNKTLALKGVKEKDYSNLMIITKSGPYYFKLSQDKERPHQFVEIKKGVINQSLSKVVEKKDFEIWEGSHSMLWINKTKEVMAVNGKLVEHKQYFSKGVPILYQGVRVYN